MRKSPSSHSAGTDHAPPRPENIDKGKEKKHTSKTHKESKSDVARIGMMHAWGCTQWEAN